MGFLRVFIHYCTKSLRNFTVLLWWWSNLQDSRLFDRSRCASNKMDNFIRRNEKFWAKKLQKIGFFGDFTHYCTESLRNFTVVLRWCSNLQDSRPFDRARCDSNKIDNFSEEKNVLGQKTSKKWVFGFITHYCTKSLRNFTVLLRSCSNLQDGRLFDCARCASNKMDKFFRRKKVLGQKTSKKIGFLGFSHITAPNRFGILLIAPMMLKITGWSLLLV